MTMEPLTTQTPQTDRNTDDIYKALQDNTWAGGNLLRGEIPRMVIIAAADFAALTARVEFHRWIFLVPGGAGVADGIYVCIKNAADAYAFSNISHTAGSATSDLKDNMVANGLVTNGGATPLNLDGGALRSGNTTVDGHFVQIGANRGLGFFNHAAAAQGTVTGTRGGITALGNLLTILDGYGIVVNNSTP